MWIKRYGCMTAAMPRPRSPDPVPHYRKAAVYLARDMAAFCGLTLDAFYRARTQLEQPRSQGGDGMPAPYKTVGTMCWHTAAVDAWRLGRTLPAPANDEAAAMPASDTTQWQAHLRARYAPRASSGGG